MFEETLKEQNKKSIFATLSCIVSVRNKDVNIEYTARSIPELEKHCKEIKQMYEDVEEEKNE